MRGERSFSTRPNSLRPQMRGNRDSSVSAWPSGGTKRRNQGNQQKMSAAAEPKKIRVAVVGTGEFGRNHARVYRELGGAELVGLYDRDQKRAAEVAREFQTPVLQSLEE